MPFEMARENFYAAARYGLNARPCWLRDKKLVQIGMRALIMDDLLPLARRGLQSVAIPDSEIDEYLGVIAARVDSGQNGAAWQKRWVHLHGSDLHELVQEYSVLQDAGEPVHTWKL